MARKNSHQKEHPNKTDPNTNGPAEGDPSDEPGQDGGQRSPNNPRGPKNFASRGALGWLIFAGLGAVLLVLITSAQNQAEKKSWQQFLNYAQGQWFEGPVTVEDKRIVGTLKPDTPGLQGMLPAI